MRNGSHARRCIFAISTTVLLTSRADGQATASAHYRAALRDTLVAIVLDMYAGWEPQTIATEAEAIARARKYFVTDSAFAMVIDATYRASFDEWAQRTAVSIPATFREYREQRHHLTAVRLLPLGDRAAAVTIAYCVDFVKRNGDRGTARSGATLVFVRPPGGWRIAQYHGSHGAETIGDVGCSPA